MRPTPNECLCIEVCSRADVAAIFSLLSPVWRWASGVELEDFMPNWVDSKSGAIVLHLPPRTVYATDYVLSEFYRAKVPLLVGFGRLSQMEDR